jgi:lipopolysaccharide export system ATP-binding protein
MIVQDDTRLNMHKLKADSLVKTIKKTPIVRGMSLEVRSAEVVGLLGPNGAGKTTTFYMICGLIQATEGKVYFDNEDISSMPLHQRALKGIGYLPQESSIFKDLTVEDNLLLASEVTILDEQKRLERVEYLLELFNIEPIRHRLGVSLSGGERRRTEIARALVNEPKFLLLDEPFAGVDPIAVMDIQGIIEQLVDIGIGVLITDHNVRETLSVCDRAYVIKAGTLLASGTSEEISHNKDVRTHYLGESFKL